MKTIEQMNEEITQKIALLNEKQREIVRDVFLLMIEEEKKEHAIN